MELNNKMSLSKIITLKDLIRLGMGGNDITDKVFDYLICFEYDETDLTDDFNAVMELVARDLVVYHINRDCIGCDITGWLKNHWDFVKAFCNEFYLTEYADMVYAGFDNFLDNDGETFCWLLIDGFFTDMVVGNWTETEYKFAKNYLLNNSKN